MKSKIKDYVGVKVGMVMITHFMSRDTHTLVWKGMCDCGKERIVKSSNFAILRKNAFCNCATRGKKVKIKDDKRRCRKCNGVLTVNYFYHPSCLENLSEHYGADDYGYSYVG